MTERCPYCGAYETDKGKLRGKYREYQCGTSDVLSTHRTLSEGRVCLERQRDALKTEQDKFIRVLSDVDVVMDTAAQLGVRNILGETYASGWADVHQRVRELVPNPT